MIIGYKALMRSAEISGLEEIEEELAKEKAAKKAAKQEAKKNKKSTNSVEPTDDESEQPEVIEVPPVEETIYPEVATVEEPPIYDATSEATVADDSVEESFEASTEDTVKTETKKSSSGLTTAITIIAGILGVALALALFIFIPDALAGWLSKFTPEASRTNWRPVFAGFIKIIILILYMSLVCLMKDIRRTFEYHGAEHKTIFCYEAGLELTVENVRKQRRFHPRCGTSFLILMLIVSIAVGLCIDPIYMAITGHAANKLVFSLIKLCLLPLTMGIGYELIKLAGRHDNLFTRIISAPGLWLQRLTVKEPSDDMIECAIAAFKEVIPEDQSDKY
jgi:uncharacterized protein YqhQ